MHRFQLTFAFILACLLSTNSLAQEKDKRQPKVEMLTTRVLVVNPDGEPLEGAVVFPSGLRTIDDIGSHYGWMSSEFGEIQKVETGADGIAHVRYPRYVHEKKRTTKVTWTIEHPEYAQFREDLQVTKTPARAVLAEGYRIAATSVNSETGLPIKEDIYGLVSSGLDAKWSLKNGVLISPVFAEEQSALRIMHIPDDGPMLFSTLIDAPTSVKGSRAFLKGVELAPGVVVRGKLDDSIPRPIKNGHVSALIVSRLDGAKRNYRTDCDWWDQTEIMEDGTFEFPSLPPGDVLQMIPVCDGYVSVDPDQELAKATFGERGELSDGFTSSQFIRLEGNSVSPVLKMTKAATLHVLVIDQDEAPVPNCKVYMWPNQRWFDSGTQILGEGLKSSDLLKMVRRGEKLTWDKPSNIFNVETDENGRATITQLPVNRTEGIVVEHEQLELPANGRDRAVEVDLKANQKNKITLKLQPKGTDIIGGRDDKE